ncbi:MAG: hypothetical protein ACW97P_10115 [Candidatus Hodarchaeales archaeon]
MSIMNWIPSECKQYEDDGLIQPVLVTTYSELYLEIRVISKDGDQWIELFDMNTGEGWRNTTIKEAIDQAETFSEISA